MKEEEETAYHFLGKCNAMMMACDNIFGAYLTEASELQQVQPHALLRFARPSNSLFNLLVISELCIRLRRQCWMAFAILPEGKDKGKR